MHILVYTLIYGVLQIEIPGTMFVCFSFIRNPSTGSWRAIKLCDGVLKAPTSAGWGEQTYYVVLGAGTPQNTKETTAATETPGYYPAVSTALSVGR